MKYFSSLAALVLGSTLACGDLLEEPCLSTKCAVTERCRSDGDCLEQEICESGYCTDPATEASPVSEPMRINGATWQEGRASSEGSVPFSDVTVVLQDELGGMIYNPTAASVLYWKDAASHRCFVVEHPEYTPTAECPRLSSSKQQSGTHPLARLTLTSAPLQLLSYDEREDPTARLRDEESAEAFHLWGRNNGRYLGCREKDQLLAMLDGGSFIVKIPYHFMSGGLRKILADEAVDNVLGYFSQRMTAEWDENAVADVYLFLPGEYGFRFSTGSLWTVEARSRRAGEQCSTVPEPTGTPDELTACDSLPACIRFSSRNDCGDPCIWTGSEEGTLGRCVLPCETHVDCGYFGDFLLRCQSLSRFGGMEGNGCFLSACTSSAACAPGEECVALDDYPHQETASGAEPAAMMNTFDVCYPVECLEE